MLEDINRTTNDELKMNEKLGDRILLMSKSTVIYGLILVVLSRDGPHNHLLREGIYQGYTMHIRHPRSYHGTGHPKCNA